MKDFSDFNGWVRDNRFSDLTTITTRAVSRVAAIRNDIYRTEQDYVSAYNSVQTLGYNSQGEIQDQTSADRLSIPAGVLSKVLVNLDQQKSSLAIDREQFSAEFIASNASVGGFDYVRNIHDDARNILNFGGVMQILVNRKDNNITASAHMSSVLVDSIIGKAPNQIKSPTMPNIVFCDSQDGTVRGCLWSDAHTFPDPVNTGGTVKTWRVIIFKDGSNVIRAIVDFNDQSREYCFYFTNSVRDSNWLIYGFNQAVNRTKIINTDGEAVSVFAAAGYNTFGPRGLMFYDSTNSMPQLIPITSMNQQQMAAYNNLFAYEYWAITVGSMYTSTLDTLFKQVFDALVSITPENLEDLINIIKSDE